MLVRFANAPVSWGIMEVKGWSPPLTYATFLDELKSAGYEGTELGPYGYLPTDKKTLSEELAQRELTLISAFVPLSLKDPGLSLAEMQKVAELLGALEAEHIVLADRLWPEREAVAGRVEKSGVRLTQSQWTIVADNVKRSCDLAASYGLQPVFHHHVGSYIETPDETGRIVELTDAGLCLDTGHYAYGGGDPLQAVEDFGSRIQYLHFKDINPAQLSLARQKQLDFLSGVSAGVFCELGAGCVAFPGLMEKLQKLNYKGWVCVEQDINPANTNGPEPVESARASRAYLRAVAGV